MFILYRIVIFEKVPLALETSLLGIVRWYRGGGAGCMRAIEPLTQLHSTHSEFAQEGCQKETEHLTNMSHNTNIHATSTCHKVHATCSTCLTRPQHAKQINPTVFFEKKKQHNNPMHFL